MSDHHTDLCLLDEWYERRKSLKPLIIQYASDQLLVGLRRSKFLESQWLHVSKALDNYVQNSSTQVRYLEVGEGCRKLVLVSTCTTTGDGSHEGAR
jgi:hypothetical protein